jgi:hypothetical protein
MISDKTFLIVNSGENMIIISDLNESYMQEVTTAEMSSISGGKSDYSPNINIVFPDINIAVVSIIQINTLTNYTNNYADVNIKF